MLSGRFDGHRDGAGVYHEGPKEAVLRGVGRRLKHRGANVLVVEAGATEEFGEQTMSCMRRMRVMVAFCFENYGEKTSSVYCSYYEVKYAHENKIPILPLKLYDGSWPPAPLRADGTVDEAGATQNAFVFGPSKMYTEFGEPFDETKLDHIADFVMASVAGAAGGATENGLEERGGAHAARGEGLGAQSGAAAPPTHAFRGEWEIHERM